VHSSGKQRRHNGGMVIIRRSVEGLEAGCVVGIRLGPGINQDLDGLGVALLGCVEKRRLTFAIGRIDVGCVSSGEEVPEILC
jgi:hypothetical protein